MRRALAPLAAALLLSACESMFIDEYNAPAKRKYPTPAGASAACLDAAERARKWCLDQNLNTDTLWADNCRAAQWDYNRACR